MAGSPKLRQLLAKSVKQVHHNKRQLVRQSSIEDDAEAWEKTFESTKAMELEENNYYADTMHEQTSHDMDRINKQINQVPYVCVGPQIQRERAVGGNAQPSLLSVMPVKNDEKTATSSITRHQSATIPASCVQLTATTASIRRIPSTSSVFVVCQDFRTAGPFIPVRA